MRWTRSRRANNQYDDDPSTGPPTDLAGLADIAEATRARVNKATPINYAPAALIPLSHVMPVAQNVAATLGAIQSVVEAADGDAFDSSADYAKTAIMVAARFATSDGETVTFYRVADTLLQFPKNMVCSLLIRRGGQYDRLAPATYS